MTPGLRCGTCGADLRSGARFCDRCGVPTAISAEAAKYKQVTVLFADVVGSMDIAAAVELERLREIMTPLVDRLAALARRYGGTVEHTGDGVMAIFGAPIALEDHAFRGCLAATAIQDEAGRRAAEVLRRDGVALQVRVGLNSGQVIAGEADSGSLGYTATGRTIGYAQRIESAAPPGAVLLSESTARLVAHTVTVGGPEWVHIKGAPEPVRAHRLVAINPPESLPHRAEAGLVGRGWEMALLEAMVDRTIDGRGAVVSARGPAGIGKSRVAREIAALAAGRGVAVAWGFCESHAREVPFHAVVRLFRAGLGVADLDDAAARIRLAEVMPPDADPDDLLLLADLLGIADPDRRLPQIEPDARRRRLTAMLNTATQARAAPALFVIEDAHWIDAASESMLVDLLTAVPQTKTMVLITARPEYQGGLTQVPGGQTLTLARLRDSDTRTLLGELLGADPSVDQLTATIAERAAGNAFFAEETVRELAQRGVLAGGPGAYTCAADIADVGVPATVQAIIEARIDRLGAEARQALNAASVIGVRFDKDMLDALGAGAAVEELLAAELIDQVRFTPAAGYAFRHPLIRAVAYDSQLRADRAGWHRRLAAAIENAGSGGVAQNAVLIAEHLESAGDLRAAYGWQMRAGASAATRDVAAARFSWERARLLADKLPPDEADPAEQVARRIAPRTLLCATDFQARAVEDSRGRFGELRALCDAADDKVSLAIGMTGFATELLYAGRSRESARLASEQLELLESIGDADLTAGLAFLALASWFDAGEFEQILSLSQRVIELTDGDPTKGAGLGFGAPLAAGQAFRGIARWWTGRPGWRRDLEDAGTTARDSDPATLALLDSWTCGLEIGYGVLRADDAAVQRSERTLQIARATTNDHAVFLAEFALAVVLLNRDSAADRERGLKLVVPAVARWRRHAPYIVPVAEAVAARARAQGGDPDAALPTMRHAVDDLLRTGRIGFGVLITDILVTTLLERASSADLAEARAAIDRLAQLPGVPGPGIPEITLLRLRALFTRAVGDAATYRDLAQRYLRMAETLGFEGHLDRATAMQ